MVVVETMISVQLEVGYNDNLLLRLDKHFLS